MEENKVNGAESMNAGTINGGNPYGSINYAENVSESTINSTNTTTNKSTGTIKNTSAGNVSGVPAKVSIWTKVKQFLCQDITVELTPKQEKAFKEVYDFWHQDITAIGTKDFWLRNIEITL